MSAGYAERLKEYPNKGVCGLPEKYDSQQIFASKMDRLAQLIKQSNYTVVLTGAGISTSSGIPDFRGPSGIWTKEERERKKKKKKKKNNRGGERASIGGGDNEVTDNTDNSMNARIPRKRKSSEMQEDMTKKFISFEKALPTYTHRVLTHLILHPPLKQSRNNNSEGGNNSNDGANRTYLHHIVTQNIDGLHCKTDLPRDKISILHGDIFKEVCDTCGAEHVREKEIQSIGLKHTGRLCTLGGSPPGSCPGKLKDTLLDWEDDLPQTDWMRAETECSKADLVVCLGTSLRIEPAAGLCEYPELWPIPKEKKALGYAIVNLQETPYDEDAELVVRAKVDDVMKGLMERLGYEYNWDAIVIDD